VLLPRVTRLRCAEVPHTAWCVAVADMVKRRSAEQQPSKGIAGAAAATGAKARVPFKPVSCRRSTTMSSSASATGDAAHRSDYKGVTSDSETGKWRVQ
jgi:hypothetical protein